jgi:hypothetical protein
VVSVTPPAPTVLACQVPDDLQSKPARTPTAPRHLTASAAPVWAESVGDRTGIASIGRNHKTEKARLMTALERDMKILGSIDATA